MKFPWMKPAPVDLEALKAAARAEGAAAAEQTLRAMVASSPMLGAPGLTAQSPYPVYGYDHPIYYSTQQAPNRRPGSVLTIDTLRQMADRYDVLRACIQHLKREVAAVPVMFAGKDPRDNSEETRARIAEASAFFQRSGGLGGFQRRRGHFESQVIEDVCVVGATAIYYAPTRGGSLYEAIPIDAATIRPRADAFGFPGPGEEVYEQWIEGVLIRGYTHDEMTYDGLYPRSWTPYFASPVEWLANAVNSALRADDWNRAWLTDGNTPDVLIGAPESWTPSQVKEYAAYFDALLSGDPRERQKAKIVPGAAKMQTATRKDQDFQEFELWLLRRTCAIMGVQPASIGFAGEQYKVSQTDSMESTSLFGVGVLLDFRKSLYDDILERLGYPDLECQNIAAREEKATERATRNVALVGGGIKTINEARKEEGLPPVANGDGLLVPSTMTPLAGVNPSSRVSKLTAIAGPFSPKKGDEESGDSGEAPDDARRAALAQWERKALNRLKAGRSAACGFVSAAVSDAEKAGITAGLAECETAEAVRAVFRAG